MTEQSTELQTTQAATPTRGGIQLNTLADLQRFGQCVVKSGMAPKKMNAEGVVVAVQMGYEVGLSPMQAVQNIANINGRPSIWGDAAKGLVEASGLCEDFQEYIEGEHESMKAVCVVKRIGRSAVKQTFSVADAKQAKLWKKEGPWQEYPKRMLQMRARSFAIRDAFPDVLRGLNFAEEVQDIPRERKTVDPIPPETHSEPAAEPAPQEPEQPAQPTTPTPLAEDPGIIAAFEAAGTGERKRASLLQSAEKNGWPREKLMEMIGPPQSRQSPAKPETETDTATNAPESIGDVEF